LAKLLSSASSSSGTGTSHGTSSTGEQSGSGTRASGSGTTKSGTSGSGTAGTGAGSAAGDSPAQLADDQASIDDARAALIEAQQSRADARLSSPLAGRIAAVGLAAGQSVTAGATADGITIINSGSYEATASLTSTQASEVKVGDKAQVSVEGASATLAGTVARVGPVDGSGTSYTYPVVVALSPGSHGMAAGSTAQIEVVLHQVKYALAIPTSAVHTVALGDSYAMVLESGREVRQTISVGVVGSAYTQIKSGLAKGATVILADLSEAVPSSSTNTSVTGFGGGAGFAGRFGGGGGGAGGGGFAGRGIAG
jgi:multidrug efflux pump subunit AcrA (membrane-fusion protein)